MICLFCGKRKRCWGDRIDIEEEFVKCEYDEYELDDSIDVEDLIAESERRIHDNMEEK